MKTDYIKLFRIFNKRLLRKPGFIIMLLLIPMVVLLLFVVSNNESGIARIALVCEGKSDIIPKLMAKDSVFLYVGYNNKDDALKELNDNKVDAVWIFSGEFEKGIADYTNHIVEEKARENDLSKNALKGDKGKVVTVIENEDTVLLKLARLQLFGAMYSELSYSLFKDYIYLKTKEDREEILEKYYRIYQKNNSLFKYRENTAANVEEKEETQYLFAPVKGLLLMMVLLCGFSSTMFYTEDREKGIIDRIPVGNKWVFEHIYILTALVDASIVVFFVFLLYGQTENVFGEVILMLMYVISCCCFCSIIRKIFPGLRSLGAFIPVIMIVMLVVCPVFVYVKEFRSLQVIFPPFYYLMAENDRRYFMYFGIYLVVTIVVDVLVGLGSRCSS
ncbi:MAG: ABC transporter permease [Lachnospiraceae bacterium]|nr:ABC transporter permease [Lachnospiraceae bacterium]